MIKVLRVFHDNENIIWTHALEGPGIFPLTIEDELKEQPIGTACIELVEENDIDAFMHSDDNKMLDGKLIIGTPRPIIEPIPPRDLAAEIDALKASLMAASIPIVKTGG